jgi:sialic acid synthase SpsE
VDELNQMLEDGEIDIIAYAKAMETVGAAEIEALGLDPDEFEDLSEMIEESGSAIAGLSDDLKGNEREANDVAKALMRYDRAVKNVADNSEDWMKILKSGNLQDQAKIIDDLRESYADMLDIDMDVLSDSFLRNAKNLELMTKAANGSEEAYRQLQAVAAQDILMTLGLNDSEAMTKFQQDLEWLMSYDSSVFGNIADLAVGADLNDEAFLQELSNLVTAAGMTAE